MMFSRLGLIKSINKDQKGFTLLELLLALLIGAIITGGITATIFQVVIGSARTNNHMIAVRQVQNGGYWVSHDAQMAQTVVPTWDVDGFPLKLSWVNWDGTSYKVTYTIASGELKRQLLQNGSQTSLITVTRYIDPDSAKTKCQLTGGGTFTLPDSGDTFTISGGALVDNGRITVATGSISVTAAGGATINGGATWTGTTGQSAPWTTPATVGTVAVRATAASTAGVWTSTAASATVAITADTDGDATITGGTLTLTVTVTVGTGSQKESETRVYKIVPRASSA